MHLVETQCISFLGLIVVWLFVYYKLFNVIVKMKFEILSNKSDKLTDGDRKNIPIKNIKIGLPTANALRSCKC